MPHTLLDIQKLNGNDQSVGLIEESLKFAPELEIFPFRTIRGTTYKTAVRTELPTTGFRKANEGQASSKSKLVDRLVQTYVFGGNIVVDKAVALADERGAAAFQMMESMGIAESAMRNLGKQIFTGTVTDDKGFPGLKQATPFGAKTTQGDDMVINAGGDAAGQCGSVYAVRWGIQDIHLVGGQGNAFQMGAWREQLVEDSDGNSYDAFVNALTGWIGLQVVNQNSVRRIANLDTTNTLTDARLAELLRTFPIGYMPDAIFMSRRSRAQLQTSRSVTLFGQGRNRPNQEAIAPLPTEYDGIPIITTDSIVDDGDQES